MNRWIGLALLAACGPRPVEAVGNLGGTADLPLAPVITAYRVSDACPLAWEALDEIAPPTIPLRPIAQAGSDDCPTGFDPRALLAHPCADCVTADLAPGRRAVLQIDGPAGSGRYVSLGLVVDGRQPAIACLTASTVGWRHLYEVADQLSPLPWLTPRDGARTSALIVWDRLPWGGSEIENAMVPVVYALDGDTLVRRDDRGRALAHRVAGAYATLARKPRQPAWVACYRAVADALDHWGR